MLEKMLHHKLLTEGEQGQGVVTEKHVDASESSSNSFSFRITLQGHITFPDGTRTEFKSDWLSTHNVGDPEEGEIVPVRYDPSDHSKVVLDVVAMEAKHKAEREKDRAWLEEDKQRKIAEADAEAARANAETRPGLS
jgi:regulator of protease activity HflC (stomatin/prohibitin superfamily)